MPGELDRITLQIDCPTCGATISVPYEQVRLYRAAGCACGNLFRIEDDTPLAAVQRLIDEANPMRGENDA